MIRRVVEDTNENIHTIESMLNSAGEPTEDLFEVFAITFFANGQGFVLHEPPLGAIYTVH